MLSTLLDAAVVTFAVASMGGVGVTYTLRQIVGPLANVRLVALGLVANFVLVPVWAIVITRVLALQQPYEVGLLLVAAGAGAPFLVKLVALADGDVAFAAALLVLLLPATVVYMPLVVPLVEPDANVDATAIATSLAFTTLAPLAVGILVLAIAPALARRLQHVLRPISTVALIVLLVLTVALNASELLDVLGERAIIGAFLLVTGAFVIGFALGWPDHHRDEIGLATAQRNMAAATVVATQSIGNADTLVTVVVTSTVSMAVLFPLSSQLRKRFGCAAEAARDAHPRHAGHRGRAPTPERN